MALTAVIAYLVQFFRMTLDYTGVHKLQFEDEEYLYYVKAVPKMKVAPGDKTVTRIEEDRDEGMIDLKEEIEYNTAVLPAYFRYLPNFAK